MAQLSIRERLLLRRKISILTGFIAMLLGIITILAAWFGYWVMPGFPLFNYILGIFFFVISYLLFAGLRPKL
jgi:hypothetical protein